MRRLVIGIVIIWLVGLVLFTVTGCKPAKGHVFCTGGAHGRSCTFITKKS